MSSLTFIDVVDLQRSVFRSARLRDMVGTSRLVRWASTRDGALADAGVDPPAVLAAAGGVVVLEHGDRAAATSAMGRISRALWERAPGIEVAAVHCDFESGGLAAALLEAQWRLAREKTRRLPSVPLLGLGVTEACRQTGMPAAALDHGAPISATVAAARRGADSDDSSPETLERAAARLGAGWRLQIPIEFDHLGRSEGERSLLGVVHLDVNGVGERVHHWIEGCVETRASDDEVRASYAEWSATLDDSIARAGKAVLDRIASRVERDAVRGPVVRLRGDDSLRLHTENRVAYLPVRTVFAGGDDLVFVCDGRLALDLATTALETLEGTVVPYLGPIGACAGVAIVPLHSPFHRAVALSRALCRSAKRVAREVDDQAACALDWHVGSPRPGQSLVDIRAREYSVHGVEGAAERDGLTCRPCLLGDVAEPGSWRWLESALLGGELETSLRGPVWRKARSKAKELVRVVRLGPDSVDRALQAWQLVEKDLALPDGLNKGFLAGRTPLLDAVELLDIHLPVAIPERETA